MLTEMLPITNIRAALLLCTCVSLTTVLANKAGVQEVDVQNG